MTVQPDVSVEMDVIEITVEVVGPPGPAGPVGAGAVASVNGKTGNVVLSAADVGADVSGAAASALTNANNYTDTKAYEAQDNASLYAEGLVTAHEAAVNPHDQYLTPDEVLEGANVTLDKVTTPGSVIISATAAGGGADGLGWTGGSYDAGTGVVTFTSDDGLGFATGDLRGEQGPAGPPGGNILDTGRWQYDSATSPPPASGQMRSDGPPSSTLWLHEVDHDGTNHAATPALQPGDQIFERSQFGEWALYDITGLTDQGVYWQFDVTWVEGSITSLSKNEIITLDFIRPPGPVADLSGGTTGQALTKASNADRDVTWTNVANSVNGQTGDVVLDYTDVGAASAAQGALADTATQPGDLATVATSGAYTDLSGRPTLGTAAAANVGDFDAAGAAAGAYASGTAYTDTAVGTRWALWSGSQAAYDALGTYDAGTLYVVTS